MPFRMVALALGTVLLSACQSGPGPGAAPAPAPTTRAPATSSAPSPPAPVPVPRLAWAPCEEGFECARLPVDGLEQGIAVTRVRARQPERRIGSLFVNPGGPGGSAVDYLQAAYSGLPAELRQRFDLVAFDPRGVGRSAPVRCLPLAELDEYFALDPSPDDAGELTALERGSRELAAGCQQRSAAVLPEVATTQVAEDLELLRRAVGDDRLSYLGYSYGTSIGAAYLDAYPTRVRAMVLDGALDPTLTWDALLEGQSRGFDVALQAFLDDCEQTRCAFRQVVTGGLGTAYDTLAARVDRTAVPVGSRSLGPGELSLGVGAALYDRGSGWPALAQGLAEAQRGEGQTLLALSDRYLERTDAGYSPLLESNVAVNCLDRPWPSDTAAYTALADRVAQRSPRFGPSIALSGLTCATWPVPATGRPHPVSGTGAPPVVVIGTTRDPATPYAWSVALAEQLDSGVLVSYDGDGHTVYREGAPACLERPVTAYLLSGQSPGTLRC